MPAPDRIKQLVDTFHNNIDAYKSGNYNETQVRVEYIDPFFQELGWDIHNRDGFAEAYKDVVHEDKLKVGASTRAPDYCFRVGGTRKFFLEAKKPSVPIKEAADPAFQLRRYAWSAKLPLSILTDFEEFAVYDCRLKPVKTDKPSKARTLYITYDQYEKDWDEIYGTFSKDAVYKGSFDKYIDSNKKKKGTATVDDAFLDEIESWRDLLAREIFKRNKDLSVRDLNDAVQRTIDRIIFLRICEDRGLERYSQLMSLVSGTGTYDRLKDFFRRADERYNSGLFHFQAEKDRPDYDNWTLNLKIDDKPLKDIIRRLYYPDSPYEFSVLPADILGQVYEQFLGKVIQPKRNSVEIIEKPEVKKAGGVYYTPTYIVDYIVKNTVGKLLENLSPEEAMGKGRKAEHKHPIRVLDPACGSGSFLIGAYQFLLDWYLNQYTQNPEKYTKGKQPKILQIGQSGDARWEGEAPAEPGHAVWPEGTNLPKQQSCDAYRLTTNDSQFDNNLPPSVIPGSPSVIPGSPSVIPGSPSVIPGPPSVIPGSPSVIPGPPSVIPGPDRESPSPDTPEIVIPSRTGSALTRDLTTTNVSQFDNNANPNAIPSLSRHCESSIASGDTKRGNLTPAYRLTTNERKRILLDHIYGVDIDAQAVEVTKLSLLLKVLEGENEQTIRPQLELTHERALPDLGNNIKCGNSLIGPDFYENTQLDLLDEETQFRINAFDWQQEFKEIFAGDNPGFDAVIGNPPWGALFEKYFHHHLRSSYSSCKSKNIESYLVFIERGILSTRENGLVSMITPDTFLRKEDHYKFREFLLKEHSLIELVETGPMFSKVRDTWCLISTVCNKHPSSSSLVRHRKINRFVVSTEERLDRFARMSWDVDELVEQRYWIDSTQLVIGYLSSEDAQVIVRKLESNPPLESLNNQFEISRGEEGSKKAFVHDEDGDITFIIPADVSRYFCDSGIRIDSSKLTKNKLEQFYCRPKIWIIRIQKMRWRRRLVCTLDGRDESAGTKTLQLIVALQGHTLSLKYLMGILSSTLMNFYCINYLSDDLNKTFLSKLPIRTIDFDNPDDVAKHDKMVELVERMLDLNKKLDTVKSGHDKTTLERQIQATDNQIDKLVYDLYGLTPEEIKIVEDATQ